MRFYRLKYFLVLCPLIMMACMGNKNQDGNDTGDETGTTEDTLSADEERTPLDIIQDEEIPESVDEIFDDFFYGFATDPDFRKSRCKVRGYDMHQKFSDNDLYFVMFDNDDDLKLQKDTTINHVGVEWIYLSEDRIEHCNFRKVDGKWQLTGIEESRIGDCANADFLSFYKEFMTDTIFQYESMPEKVCFRLEPQSEDEALIVTTLSHAEWSVFRNDLPYMDDVMTILDYGQKNESQTHKNLLIEALSSGMYIQLRFTNENGKWMLTEIDN